MITPIVITLRDGLTALDMVARVVFDLDGTVPKRWTWITPKAAWLVYDHFGTGRITSGLQLFGNVTFWAFWQNGYHALGALDDDGDGEVRGAEQRGLALWHDRNSKWRQRARRGPFRRRVGHRGALDGLPLRRDASGRDSLVEGWGVV
jgi:hypothetical protein